jgi:hypothetical protein
MQVGAEKKGLLVESRKKIKSKNSRELLLKKVGVQSGLSLELL